MTGVTERLVSTQRSRGEKKREGGKKSSQVGTNRRSKGVEGGEGSDSCFDLADELEKTQRLANNSKTGKEG